MRLGLGVYALFAMFACLSLHPYHAQERGGTLRTSMPAQQSFGLRVKL